MEAWCKLPALPPVRDPRLIVGSFGQGGVRVHDLIGGRGMHVRASKQVRGIANLGVRVFSSSSDGERSGVGGVCDSTAIRSTGPEDDSAPSGGDEGDSVQADRLRPSGGLGEISLEHGS